MYNLLIASIVLLLATVIALVVFFKKMPKVLCINLIAAAGVLLVFSAVQGYTLYQTNQEDLASLYFATQYLMDQQDTKASQEISTVQNTDRFEYNALKSFIYFKDNDFIQGTAFLQIAIDAASTDSENDIVNFIADSDLLDETNQTKLLANILQSIEERVSEKTKTEYSLVSNQATWEEQEAYLDKYGDAAFTRINIVADLAAGSYYSALESAVSLYKDNTSEENKYILAECIAEAFANGYVISIDTFQQMISDDLEAVEPDAEIESIALEVAALEEEIEALEAEIEIQINENTASELSDSLLALVEEKEYLEAKSKNLVVYRAINFIHNPFDTRAKVMEALLYVSMDDVESAVAVLTEDQNIVQTFFDSNTEASDVIAQSISALKQDDADEDAITKALVESFSAYQEVGASTAMTQLAEQFAIYYKYDKDSLYISGVDTSDFPTVRVSVSGSSDAMQAVLDDDGTLLKDTRIASEYTVIEQEVSQTITNICFVVDESGSMGADIYDARDAIIETIQDGSGDNLYYAIVGYESSAQIITPLTDNKDALVQGAMTLEAYGGTNIYSGVVAGIEALQDASGEKFMLLMTDGQDSTAIDAYVQLAIENGVTIYTVGFGSPNETLLSGIAEQTGGKYILASSSEELSSIYQMFGELILNRVQIEYVAEDTDELYDRYVHLSIDELGLYSKVEYQLEDRPDVLSAEAVNQTAETFSTQYYDLDTLLNGTDLSFTIYDEEIGYAEIVGYPDASVQVNESWGRVYYVNESLKQAGVYDLKLYYYDGREVTHQGAIVIGQRVYLDGLTIGDEISISSTGYVMLLNKQTIIYTYAPTINGYLVANQNFTITLNAQIDTVELEESSTITVPLSQVAEISGTWLEASQSNIRKSLDTSYVSESLVVQSDAFTYTYDAVNEMLVEKEGDANE